MKVLSLFKRQSNLSNRNAAKKADVSIWLVQKTYQPLRLQGPQDTDPHQEAVPRMGDETEVRRDGWQDLLQGELKAVPG